MDLTAALVFFNSVLLLGSPLWPLRLLGGLCRDAGAIPLNVPALSHILAPAGSVRDTSPLLHLSPSVESALSGGLRLPPRTRWPRQVAPLALRQLFPKAP